MGIANEHLRSGSTSMLTSSIEDANKIKPSKKSPHAFGDFCRVSHKIISKENP